MKILKNIGIALAAIIVIILIVALFTKKEYSISREVTVSRPNSEVFDYIKLLRNQDKYSKWIMADPNMQRDFKGTDGTVGFIYAWNGNDDVGKGEQEITALTEGEKLNCEIRFIEPWEGIAHTEMTTTPLSSDQTRIKWTFNSRMEYPMNIMVLCMDQMMGSDMETSLNNLKNELEK